MHAAYISRAPYPRLGAAPRALQLARYCALYSSKGYAIGITAQKWRSGCSPRSTSRPTSSPTSSGQPSRLVADGTTSYANQRLASAGMVLYRIVWSGFPVDLFWYYEPAKNLGADLVAAFGRQRWRRLRPRPRRRLIWGEGWFVSKFGLFC